MIRRESRCLFLAYQFSSVSQRHQRECFLSQLYPPGDPLRADDEKSVAVAAHCFSAPREVAAGQAIHVLLCEKGLDVGNQWNRDLLLCAKIENVGGQCGGSRAADSIFGWAQLSRQLLDHA